jgi:hypothetical protein
VEESDMVVANGQLAWIQLKQIMRALVSGSESQARLRWLSAGKLVLIGSLQVQARFVEARSEYEICFERFGAEMGSVNFERIPHGPPLKDPVVWKVEPFRSGADIFWRLNFQEITPDRLAARTIERLKDFYEEYRLSAIGA